MKATSLTKPKQRQVTDENMIPLINIVFLMLIFFLVAGQIAVRDNALFSAPQSSQDNKLDDAELTILLAADESIWVNNQQVDDDLPAHLKSLSLTPQSRVVLKVDAYLKAPILDPVVLVLQSLGIQRLRLVTIATAS